MSATGSSAIRLALVVLVGVAIAAVALANALVQSMSGGAPGPAERVWPGHPSVAIAIASRDIAADAGSGRPVSEDNFRRLKDAARKSPLATEPFIVRGIRAELEGNDPLARQAFLAARKRDPRSLSARYFLAGQRLRAGDAGGLEDVAIIARLSPGGLTTIAPYVAQFLRQPDAQPAIRSVFRNNPDIASAVLQNLAADPGNSRLVLSFSESADPERSPWIPTMIATLVSAGRFNEAKSLWGRSTGIARPAPLFDPDFSRAGPPPPFNWELTSSSVGLAERRSGRLHVIYYGQADGILARQLLTLGPGRYRLRAPASASADGGKRSSSSLGWTVRCATPSAQPAKPAIATVPVAAGMIDFSVGPDCPAQWLELAGRSADIASQRDVTIGPLALSRGAGQ